MALQDLLMNAPDSGKDKPAFAVGLPAVTEADKPTNSFDWDEYDKEALTSYRDYWDTSLSYFDNSRNLYNRVIWHGDNQEILSHVAISYGLSHSVLINFAPLLFYQGSSGSGKSASGTLIASLRGKGDDILGAQCTFASIRNILTSSRWYYVDKYDLDTSRANERPCLLVWADIKESDLSEDRKIYSLIRNGCDRKEDKLLIAGEDGENKEFRVFSPKIVSSIEPFYAYAKWSELKRRILLIKTTPLDNSASKKAFLGNRLDLDDIDFSGAHAEFEAFWTNDTLSTFATLRKNGKGKQLLKSAGLSEHEIKACFDIVLQHAVLSDLPLSDSVDIFRQYWALARSWLSSGEFSCESVLIDLIKEYSFMKQEGIPLMIEHSKCLQAVKTLGFSANPKEIGAVMTSKGFELVKHKSSSKQFWSEIL
jgi:hypothetical protein